MSEALKIKNMHFSYRAQDADQDDDASGFWNRLGFSGFSEKLAREEALSGINLSLGYGETLCITGASGQGKSLLLRLIAGLEMPTDGSFYYFGEHVPNHLHTALNIALRGVGFVFQNSALVSNLNVYDNVAMPLSYHKIGSEEERAERVNMALDLMRVRSEKDKYPHLLSSGMQKRVAIARAWAMNPKLLLLDEPIANLDVYNRRTLIPLIDNMRTLFHTAIIIVTHNLQIAEELNCNICILHDRILTPPHSFDFWLHSDDAIAQDLFRDLRKE